MLIAAAEAIDAVMLGERAHGQIDASLTDVDVIHGTALRPWALYRADAYDWDPATDNVSPVRSGRLVKFIGTTGVADLPVTEATFNSPPPRPSPTHRPAAPIHHRGGRFGCLRDGGRGGR
jgi:hypothetical protein